MPQNKGLRRDGNRIVQLRLRPGLPDPDVPVTVVSSVVPLPDEPQALDFAARP